MKHAISESLNLPNGIRLTNRLVKASTEELLADRQGRLTDGLLSLYEIWSRSGAGMIITGNMFISPQALSRRGNSVVTQDTEFRQRFTRLAGIMKQHGARALVQLNHAGRQALRSAKTQVVAPSAVAIQGFGPLFVMPRALDEAEITAIIEQFVAAARFCWECGFDGVEIHAAHGYLLSQFLSPYTNRRTDAWGGTLANRARALMEILTRVRSELPADFILSVKINSADFQRGGFAENEALELVRLLNAVKLDFIEISGGNYEAPAMAGRSLQTSTQAREAYFLDFARQAREVTTIPLMLTGGFRSAAGMNTALTQDGVSLIGLARPMILEPGFPHRLLRDQDAKAWVARDRLGIKKLDDMLQSFWYKRQIAAIAKRGRSLGPNASRWLTLIIELPKAMI